MNDIVARILELLKERNISEYQLCKACNINQSTFTTWKTENRVPHTMRLKQIAEYLNVSLDYLVYGNKKESYYINPDAEKVAQALLERPELKVLFETSRDISADDLKVVQAMIDTIRGKNNV